MLSYLQVAFSSVVMDRVVEVVPDDNDPDGEPFEIAGGVVSGARAWVVAETGDV